MAVDESFKELLTLEQWDRFGFSECEAIARDLGRELPASFRFHKVETCSSGNQKHHVAFFEWAGLPKGYHQGFFALIPGGQATLGYDREHPFVPNRQQQKSWQDETQKTRMFSGSLDKLLDMTMTPLRYVSIEPFLMETLATPLEPPPTYDEEIDGWMKSSERITREKTLQRISREGFRFPTSDEWEYACAAGSRTLFRWGNETPAVHIPALGSPKAAEWNLHLRENAFGLLIGRYPYNWEFCAEPGLMRGGDGGTALHAGAGTFAAWLTLASAFYSQWDHEVCYHAHLRRAFSLF